MKKRIIALLLAGGLVAGLCGCGGSSGTSSMPAPVVEESTPAEQVGEVEAEGAGPERPESPEKSDADEYSADNTTDEPEAATESEAPVAFNSVDLSEVMTSHVFESEDLDGYRTQETVYLSPIFRESDMDALVATWEALGGSADEIPIGEECYSWDSKLQRSLERSGFSGVQYIVGSWEILNCTEGFDLTPDNSRSFILTMRMKPDDNALPMGVYEAISQCSMTYVFFGNGLERSKSEGGILPLGNAFMDDNQWGPTPFIIVLPDKVVPNLPNGYDCHNLLFDFGSNLRGDKFYIPYYNELY